MKNSLDEFLRKYSSTGQRQPSPSAQNSRDTVDDFIGKYTSGGKPKEESVDDFISKYTSSGKGSFDKDYSSEPIVDYEEMKRLKLGERATEIASEYNPYSSTTAAQRRRVDEAVKGIGYQGLDQYNLGVASTGKFLGGKGSFLDGFTNELRVMLGIGMQDIGQGARETGEALGFKPKDDSKLEKLGRDVVRHDTNYADKVYEHYKNIADQDAAYYAKNAEGSKGLEAINKYGPTIVAALPNAIRAILTMGTSAATDTTALASRAMATAGKTGMDWVRQAVKNSAVRMVENPQFKMSFIETVGSNYMDAIESGASPEVASIYATLVGSVNSAIEVGGGIETLPADIRNSMLTGDKNKVLLEYAKSIGSEGLEEVEQGIVERGFKPLIGEETHLLPDEGRENVVLDPYSMAEEFKGGAVAAGFLGAPSTIYGYSKAPDAVKDIEPEIAEETDIPRYRPYSPSGVTEAYLNEIKAGRSEDGRINRAQLNRMLDERDKILERANDEYDKDVKKKLKERAESISEAVAITLRKDLKVGNSEVYYKTGVDVDGLLGTRESPPISAADIPPDLPKPEKINYEEHIYGSDKRSEDVKTILRERRNIRKYANAYVPRKEVASIVAEMNPEKGSDKPINFKAYYANLRKLGDVDNRIAAETNPEAKAKLQEYRSRLAEGIAYVMRYGLDKKESEVYQATGMYVDPFNIRFANPMGYIYRPDGSITDISGQHIIWDTKNVIQGDVSTSEYRTGKYAEDRGVATEFNARDLSKPASTYGGSTADPYLTEPGKRRVGSTEINTTSDMNVNVMSPDEVFDELYARGLINPNRIKFEVITDAALEKVAESSKVTRNSWLRSKINYELDKRSIKREQIAAENKKTEAELITEKSEPDSDIIVGIDPRLMNKLNELYGKPDADSMPTNGPEEYIRDNLPPQLREIYGIPSPQSKENDAKIDKLGEKSRERRNLVNPQFWQDAEIEEEKPDAITHADDVSLGREYDESRLDKTPFPAKTKSALDDRQTTGLRNSMDDAQKAANKWSGEGGGEHTAHSDEMVNATAEELLSRNGYDAETERLANLPIGQWTDVDIVEANTIILAKTHELQEGSLGMAKANRLIVDEESRRLADLKNRREEALRRTARVERQANRSVINQYQNIMQRAEKVFSTKKEEARGTISPNNKMADTLRAVKDFASKIFFSADKDTNEIISLIHEISEYRGTSKVLGGKAQKLVDMAIRKVAQMEGGYEFLRNVAFAQADAITTDAISGFRGSTLESIKTYRVAALLSGLRTWVNNFGNNSVSIFASATNQNLGIGFDKMFSNITGTRTIGKDTSWKINKANMKAVEDAMLKAMLNVMFDVNVDSDGNPTINPDAKYENSGNNWFKMSGNVAEQVLAQFQMLIRTTLVVPDEIAKAQIRQGLSKNVDGMTNEARAELKNDTEAQASYRTFQNKGTIAKAINYIRDGMNKWQIKDRKGGTIGIGDIVAVFATVPANVVEHRIENSPIGWTKSTVNMLLGVYKAKKGELSATEQAKISRDCGRTLGSVGLAAASAFMASLGALGNADFEDDDERKAALKDNGVDGLFLNLDGFARALAGQDSRYEPGDKVVDLDWLEVFSVPVAIGSFMGLSLKEGDNPVDAFWNAGKYSIDNTWETILSLPGMDAIKRLSDGVKFSKEEKTGAKIADGILPYLSSTLMSYVVPNVIPQFAAGIDNKARDVYNADSPMEKARNVFLERSGIFRGALPTKKDNFGRTIDYGGFQNKALLPGSITKTKSSPIEKELNRLSNQGLSGAYPQKSAPSKIEDKALSSEQRRKYEATYSKTYNETVNGVMNSFGYKRLSDSQKNDALKMAKSYAKDIADAEARRALGLEAKELQGWKNLSKQDRTMFISTRENIAGFYKLKDGKQTLVDYSGMDNFIKKYGEAAFGREKVVEAITSTFSKADDIYEASKVGINSKTYMSVYEAYKKIDDNEDLTNTQKTIKLKQVISATARNDEQKEFLEDNLKYYNHMAAHSDSYDEMVDMGIPEVKAEKTYNTFKALTPSEGKKTVSDKQKYKAIASMSFLTDEEKWKVFDSIATDAAIKNSKSGRVSGSYNDWLVNSRYN